MCPQQALKLCDFVWHSVYCCFVWHIYIYILFCLTFMSQQKHGCKVQAQWYTKKHSKIYSHFWLPDLNNLEECASIKSRDFWVWRTSFCRGDRQGVLKITHGTQMTNMWRQRTTCIMFHSCFSIPFWWSRILFQESIVGERTWHT